MTTHVDEYEQAAVEMYMSGSKYLRTKDINNLHTQTGKTECRCPVLIRILSTVAGGLEYRVQLTSVGSISILTTFSTPT